MADERAGPLTPRHDPSAQSADPKADASAKAVDTAFDQWFKDSQFDRMSTAVLRAAFTAGWAARKSAQYAAIVKPSPMVPDTLFPTNKELGEH
jgi:hypothetical protein